MNFNDIVMKITSRKFLSAIAVIIAGLCMAFDVDRETIESIAGVLTSLIATVVYTVTEASIDKADVQNKTDERGGE